MYFDTRATKQDLLADIDAWGVYKYVPKTAQESSSFDTLRDLIVAQYGEGTPSGESATEYERQVTIGRGTGIIEFLCHYGFGSPNNLNSQSSAVANVEKEVRLFGEVWYLRNAGFSSEQLMVDTATGKKLDDASKEMTKIFLEWLENLAKQQEVSSLYCESPSSTLPKGSE
jgi:hypothetical protein